MPILFNSLLSDAGVDVKATRLVRHQDARTDPRRTPYHLWREHPTEFMAYQSSQGPRKAKVLGGGSHWAVFVVTPSNETLFAGLYHVDGRQDPDAASVGADTLFALSLSDRMQEYRGRVIIEWGNGFLSWAQFADRNNKEVVKLHGIDEEDSFPGYLKFRKQLSEIAKLPSGWIGRLKEAKGVYVLTCPKTSELYVGSATGQDGFYERWLQHANAGGDAFHLKSDSDYQVSILEVAGSGMSQRDIVHAEMLWMEKLQTNKMGGLNSRVISSPKALAEAAQP